MLCSYFWTFAQCELTAQGVVTFTYCVSWRPTFPLNGAVIRHDISQRVLLLGKTLLAMPILQSCYCCCSSAKQLAIAGGLFSLVSTFCFYFTHDLFLMWPMNFIFELTLPEINIKGIFKELCYSL